MAIGDVEKEATVCVGSDKDATQDVVASESGAISSGAAHLQRKLGGKEVQLFAMGGAIGTSTRKSPSINTPGLIELYRRLHNNGSLAPTRRTCRPLPGLFHLVL